MANNFQKIQFNFNFQSCVGECDSFVCGYAGKKEGWCPYFLTRHMLSVADVVVYNYQYMLDPKVASLVSKPIVNPNSNH